MINCRFLYPNTSEDLVHPAKCQGQQVTDQLVIKLYVIRLRHLTNHSRLRILNERRSSTTSLEARFLRLETRAYNGCTFKILFELLISEFAEVDSAGRPFIEYVQSFLTEAAPRIELSLRKYRNRGNDEPLRCAHCSICQSLFQADSVSTKIPFRRRSKILCFLFLKYKNFLAEGELVIYLDRPS